ncbi:glycosyltransferase [Frankia sp. Mgl5]|uniref:glycosyltransferase family 2 protein n=1 Tax=Frankia sp. Mgl5 TaxID=2933793 RepID=UPI00200C9246|nr:cellulose synthase catalytic subunit [Frankia sp. Mgl5]MCK9932648.1 glycosyltransferase [Frankia sp. Mgl5]
MAYQAAPADVAGPASPEFAPPSAPPSLAPREPSAVAAPAVPAIPTQAVAGDSRDASRAGIPPLDGVDTWVRVPVTWWRAVAGRVVGVAITLIGAVYAVWRAGTLDGTGVAGHLFYAAEIVSYLTIVWTAVMTGRMRTGYVRRAPAPAGTLDVFVTVCGEPVEMVEATLRAALAIDYPHRTYVLNDGRIAGRPNWRDIDALAARLGLTCFTRTDGPRGKAANLNHGLARTDGDAIMTLDADHIAVPDLGELVLGYLRDPKIGFVCTEQRFDVGRHDVLNNAEPMLYKAVQPAKDRDSAASSCGNGTLYRRTAVESVGGFSEWNIVEDLHTSYQLHAAGWQSVYHHGPVSVGIAPATAAEYAKQRSRWAMDGLRLLLFDNPLRKPGLTGWQRAHYLHTGIGYLVACAQMMFLLGPPLSVLAGVQIAAGVSLTAYVLHALPYLVGSLLFIVAYTGPRGAQRTVASTLFNAPLYALSFVRVVLSGRPDSGATAKTALPRMSLLLLPQVLFAASLVVTILVVGLDPDVADLSALVWAGVLLSMVAGPLSALSERQDRVERAQLPIRAVILGLVLSFAVVTLLEG